MQTSEHSPPAESCSISRSYGDASASFVAAPAKGGLHIHTASAKRRGFLIRRLGLRLLARRRELPNEPRIDAAHDEQEAARLGGDNPSDGKEKAGMNGGQGWARPG